METLPITSLDDIEDSDDEEPVTLHDHDDTATGKQHITMITMIHVPVLLVGLHIGDILVHGRSLVI